MIASVSLPTGYSMPMSAAHPSCPVVSNPVKVLQNVLHKKVSGRLTLGQSGEQQSFWRLHVGQGQLHYAGSVLGSVDRLRYILHH